MLCLFQYADNDVSFHQQCYVLNGFINKHITHLRHLFIICEDAFSFD